MATLVAIDRTSPTVPVAGNVAANATTANSARRKASTGRRRSR
jgi:hypothetical protein